jgi:hypothetical protein
MFIDAELSLSQAKSKTLANLRLYGVYVLVITPPGINGEVCKKSPIPFELLARSARPQLIEYHQLMW